MSLHCGPTLKPATVTGVNIEQSKDKINIDTGADQFVIRRAGFNFIDEMTIGITQLIKPGDSNPRAFTGPCMTGEDNTIHWTALDQDSTVEIEDDNPLQTVIRAEGWHKDPRGFALGRYVVRLYFLRQSPLLPHPAHLHHRRRHQSDIRAIFLSRTRLGAVRCALIRHLPLLLNVLLIRSEQCRARPVHPARNPRPAPAAEKSPCHPATESIAP